MPKIPLAFVGLRENFPLSLPRSLRCVLLAGFLLIAASSAWAQTVATDRDDYSPGDTAYIAGADYAPGEMVDLSISIDNPATGGHIGDYAWTIEVTAADGSFLTSYVVPGEAAGMNLTLTAIGYESARLATATFTDTDPSTYSISSPSMTLVGNQVTFSVVVSGGNAGVPVTGAGVLGATADFVSINLTLTGPTGFGNGTYTGSFTATRGRRYQWNWVDVGAQPGAFVPLGSALSVTAPVCFTAVAASGPPNATVGDTSISVSAIVSTFTGSLGGFLFPANPSSGTVNFFVYRYDEDFSGPFLVGTLPGAPVMSGGATGSQSVTVSPLSPGFYQIVAFFNPPAVADGSGGIRYSGELSPGLVFPFFTPGPLCQPVSTVSIAAPGEGSVLTSTDCSSASVAVFAAADGTTPTFGYQVDGGLPGPSATVTVPLGDHTITVYADNDCTGNPLSASVNVSIKANTVVTLGTLPSSFGTGSCPREVSATLTDSCGTALAGRVLDFEATIVAGLTSTTLSLGSRFTDANGVAAPAVTDSSFLAPGSTVTYTASFAGSNTHFASTSTSAAIGANYTFVGFQSPLSNTATKVKRGSTVPVKFELLDCAGNPVTTGNHTILVLNGPMCAPFGDPLITDAGSSNDDGNLFRLSGHSWIFNLQTNSTYCLNASYFIRATLDDGSAPKDVYISIKP